MPRLLTTTHGIRTARQQAEHYYARRRQKAHINPALGLFGTHSFLSGDSGFDVGDAFPNRDRAITVAVDVQRDSTGARGILIELGDSTTGLAVWIDSTGENIQACAGDAGDDGVTLLAEGVLLSDTQIVRVVFSVVPGSGQARLWVNGEIRAAGASVNSPLPNGWAADSAAGIGEVSGTASDRIPAGDKITLTNATLIWPLRMFDGQRPRHFGAAVVTVTMLADNILTESGDTLITEAGDTLEVEDG